MMAARILNRCAFICALAFVVPFAGPRASHAQPQRTESDGGMMMARPSEARWPRTDQGQPDGWPQLSAQVKANLSNGPLLPFPVSTPNVRANDPTGDQSNDAQSFVSVAAWGRFVVAVWTDTKGAEGSPGFPPTTEVGFATSCDWGATFTDGGSVPRIASNDQAFHPTLSSDGRGNFYMAATYLKGLDAIGAPTSTAIGFWRGGFDTTACTFLWSTPQALQQTPAFVGSSQIDRVRVVADPFDNYVHLIYVIRTATGKDQVAALSSADGGSFWGASRTVANGLGSGAWFVGVPDATIGPNHELYVVWSDRMVWVTCEFQSPQFVTPDGSQVYFNKSVDHGTTWSAETAISTLYSTYLSGGPTDLTGQIKVNPRLAADRTTGTNRGNIYVTWPASASWVAEPGSDSTTVEIEPNGAPNGARPLQLGESGAGVSASTTDVDYWRIDLAAGQTLLARLEPQDWACGSFSTGFGFLLQLLTSPSNGAVDVSDSLLQSSNFNGFVSQVVFSCRRSGTYYLRVQQNTLGINVNYTLRTRSVLFGQQAGSGRDEGDILLARSTSGGTSWGLPIIVNSDAPLGFQETGPSIAVDASGRVLVGWHDHRDSETDPVSVGEAQLTDSYLAESTTGGTSFGAGMRVSSARSLMGQNQREVFYSTGLHTDLVADGNHLLMGWDDQRLATRSINSVDAYVQFADREAPGIAFVGSPADSFRAGRQSVTYSWLGSDRVTPQSGMLYEGTLVNLTTAATIFGSMPGTTTTLTFAYGALPTDGWYELSVRARDAAGNVSPAFARRRFLVDGTPPVVTIQSGPGDGSISGSTSATFGWTAADLSGSVSYSTRVDGGPWSDVGSATSASISSLTDGAHQFDLRGRDSFGNETVLSTLFDSAGLVSWWTGQIDGSDSWGTSPGTMVGGATITGGRRGRGFSFNGIDGHVRIPDDGALDPGMGSFTVDAWVRTTQSSPEASLIAKYEAGISSQPVGANTSAYVLSLVSGSPVWFVRDDDQGGDISGGQKLTGTPLNDGNWHHVAALRDTAAAVLALYVDGELVDSEPLNAGASGNIHDTDADADPLLLGAVMTEAADVPRAFFSGQMDEVVFTRRAITPAELAAATAKGGRDYPVASAWRRYAVDLAAPDTKILTGPAEGESVIGPNAAFSFRGFDSATPAGSLVFSTKLDGGTFSAFSATTSLSLTGLALGSHTVTVKARDLLGHEDLTPATRTFITAPIVDLVPPQTTIIAGPAEGSTVVGGAVTFSWTGSDNFSLPSALRFSYTFDGIAAPFDTIRTLSLPALLPGPHSFSVVARDEHDNLDPTPDTRSFTFTVPAPVPVAAFAADSVIFTWSQLPLVANAFRLDIATAASADSVVASLPFGIVTRGAWRGPLLNNRSYFARVAPSVDGGGSYLLASAFSSAMIADLEAPQTLVTSGPAESGYSRTEPVVFGIGGTDNQTPPSSLEFRWRIDGSSLSNAAVLSSVSLPSLPEGAHIFEVFAIDLAGSQDATPVIRHFTVDRTPPETQIAGGPAPGAIVTTNVLTYNWTGTDDRTPAGSLRFEYKLDGGAFANTSPALIGAINNVSDGPHTFAVRALDLADNVDATPATRAVTVDALGPVITLLVGPAASACIAASGASFVWTAIDVVSPRAALQFAYSLDGGPATAFGPDTTAVLSALAEGAHTLEVRALDERGHVGTASRSFTIDTQSPLPFIPSARALDTDRVRFICTGTDNTGITGFHLQVAGDAAFASILAEVDLGSAGLYDFTGVPGNTYFGRAQARDCAGNLSGYSTVSNAASLANLANLYLPVPVEAPPTATADQVMHVQWTVGNNALGSANVAQWFDNVYLSPTPAFDAGTALFLGQVQNLTALDPNDTYTLTRDLKLPVGVQGDWYAIVVTDVTGQVPETNGNDNTRASGLINVSLGTVADLEVTQVQAPLTALTEHSATVVWKVTNTGTGRTPVDRWYDTVMISDNAAFDFQLVGNGGLRVQETPLLTIEHVGALEKDSSYTVTATVQVPAYTGGSQQKWFVVASDLRATVRDEVVQERGQVFENLHETNARVADATTISVVQPADLVVDDVRPLNTTGASSGGTIAVSWTVRNGGFSPTSTSSWIDRVWLSSDAVLDVGDVFVGDFPHGGALDLDGRYDVQPNLRIPNGLTGNRFLIVSADVAGQVREFSESNNTRTASTPISIALSPWPNLKPIAASAPDTVVAGRALQVQWQVANLSLNKALSGSWRDDIYLSASPTWNPGAARWLAGVPTTQTLVPGQSYTNSATVTVPAEFSGDFFLYFVADAANDIYEHTDEGDNLQRLVGRTAGGGGGADPLYVQPYPPVDVAVTAVTAAPLAVSTGDPLVIDWKLTNLGEASTLASSWSEQVWLSADTLWSPATDIKLGEIQHGGTLLAGGSSTGHTAVTVPNNLSGAYHVLVVSDPGGATGDGFLTNNSGASADPVVFTAIAAPPAPNLVLAGLNAPASERSGQPLNISVGVGNAGPGNITSRNYSVSAFLSLDPRLDGTDIALGSVPGPSNLSPGQTSGVAFNLTLPNYVSGPYFLILLADARGDVSEANESDNQILQPLLAVLPPPADLIVRDVQVSAPTVTPGRPMTVTYTLDNVGQNPAEGRLDNAIYLSADTVFDSVVDPLVGLEQTTITLLPGQSVTLKQSVTFRALPLASLPSGLTGVTPPLTPGPYHALVRTNVRQSIRESNGDNNGRPSVATVDGQIPELVIGAFESFELAAGQSAYFRIVGVPPTQDLTLTTQSNVGGATNEMFVAFGHTPTGSDFDFSGPAGFTATPAVLVPGTRGGDYFVLITARSLGTLAVTESVTVHAQLLPFSITSHSPSAGGQGGQVTGRVLGAGLRDTTVFRLEKAGVPIATGRVARVINSTEVLVRWSLRDVPLDTYDVVAINGPDRWTLPAAFSVEPPRAPAIVIETDQLDVLRRNAVAPFTFTFRNTSNQDAEVLRARVLYPASSVLRTLVTSPDLRTRSARAPELFAPLSGDMFVARDARTGDSLAVIDVVGGHLAPGEARSMTVAVSGLETSPYSMLAMAGTSTARDFLDREAAYFERARREILAQPQGVPAELLAIASDGETFRFTALRAIASDSRLLDDGAVELYLTGAPSGLPLPVADEAVTGPDRLLAEALAGDCAAARSVPECVVDVAPVTCSLPGCRVVHDTMVPVALPFAGGAVATVAGSTARGYSEFVCADAKVVAPCDPNVISGPVGFGAERWWSAEKAMNYKVDFENLSGVSGAPAQVARITLPLDPGFELASFRLGNAGFGGANGKTVSVPLNRTAFDNGGIFYTDLGLYVQYTAGVDPDTRLATFTFSTLDANRQKPSNAFTGFLPVNDGTGRGQGYVTFSIKPRADITSGLALPASASIVFDDNATVPTNVVTNRIDSRKPSSGVVTPVLTVLDSTHLRITWVGQDDPTGSGLKGYSVFSRRDTGPFLEVGSQLVSRDMLLNVEPGHQYAFYSRASDNTDNTEDKTLPDQLITIGSVILGTGDPQLPRVTMLHQNAPNPWRGSTLIRFDLATASEVTLEVFDVQGRIVGKPLNRKQMLPGRHAVPLDRLQGGPGVYFYRMTAKSFSGTKRMVRLN